VGVQLSFEPGSILSGYEYDSTDSYLTVEVLGSTVEGGLIVADNLNEYMFV